MKTRLGFVSNSSSTSFCIYGCCLDFEDYMNIDVIKNIVHKFPNIIDELKNNRELSEDIFSEGVLLIHYLSNIDNLDEKEQSQLVELFVEIYDSNFDILNFIVDNAYDLDLHFVPDDYTAEGDNGIYVGRSLDHKKDEETLKQFKDRTRKELLEIFGDNIKYGSYAENWEW